MLECVGVCCSVLPCVAMCCSVLQYDTVCCTVLQCVPMCCSVLQFAAVCCSVLQCMAVCCRMLQYVAVHSVLQCVAVCRSMLQRVACKTLRPKVLNHEFWIASRDTYEWVMSHIWMSHVTHMNELCHTYGWVMSHIWMRHITRMNESCHAYEWVMSQYRWKSRRLVGLREYLQLYVNFCSFSLKFFSVLFTQYLLRLGFFLKTLNPIKWHGKTVWSQQVDPSPSRSQRESNTRQRESNTRHSNKGSSTMIAWYHSRIEVLIEFDKYCDPRVLINRRRRSFGTVKMGKKYRSFLTRGYIRYFRYHPQEGGHHKQIFFDVCIKKKI